MKHKSKVMMGLTGLVGLFCLAAVLTGCGSGTGESA